MSNVKLTIDLGSTEFKAAVYDDSSLLGSGAYKLSYQRDGAKVELSLDTVFKGFTEIISKAINSSSVSIKDIGSIGVTSQAQSFALLDQDDNFITPFISWLDMRAVETCKTIRLESFAEHSSLSKLQANMQICILKHLLDNSHKTEKIKVMPLPSYLMKLLTGRYVSDKNLAAMTGLYSLKEDKYWQEALSLLKISEENLPTVIDVGDMAGKTIKNLFELPEELPVYSCANDQTAGAFGVNLSPGDILITLGTAQVVYCCCDKIAEPNSVQFRGHYPDGLYYSMFAGPGGDLITKAIKKVPEFKDFKTFAELATNADINIDAGFYIKNNEVGWFNDSAGLAEKALSVLNFLADEILVFFKQLTQNSKDIKTIYLAGGGQKNPSWVNAIEKKLHHKIKCVSASPTHGVALMISKI